MQKLADIVLGYYWFLNFSEDVVDEDAVVKEIENLAYTITNDLSNEEKDALREAAKRSLASWLREPDEHSYTPRKLFTPKKRAFLESIAAGHFSGPEDANG